MFGVDADIDDRKLKKFIDKPIYRQFFDMIVQMH